MKKIIQWDKVFHNTKQKRHPIKKPTFFMRTTFLVTKHNIITTSKLISEKIIKPWSTG